MYKRKRDKRPKWNANSLKKYAEYYFEILKSHDCFRCLSCSRWLHDGYFKYKNICILCE